jgi:glycosyltransferase involved in cell wall biosynthesis
MTVLAIIARVTILHYITPSRLGGAEEVFVRLVEDARARGHRVIVLTKRDAKLREILRERGIESIGWLTRGKFDFKTLWRLVRLIRRERVEIIHTHLTTASWLGSLAGKITRVPVLAHVHAADSKTWFQRADYLLAVSRGVRKHLIEQGVGAWRIPVVYYGLDLEKYPAPLESSEAKAALGLAPDALTVGVVASFQPRKGHRYLLDALKILEERGLQVHALFAGEGVEEATLRGQTENLGLTARVHFLGFRNDVRAVVSAFDVFCLPSFKEGLSIAVMEAMALRRPVVATNIAGMDEIVHNELTGLLVEAGDADSLADALEKVLQSPARAAKMGNAGRELVEQAFEQGARLAKLDELQRDIVASWKRKERFRANEDI